MVCEVLLEGGLLVTTAGRDVCLSPVAVDGRVCDDVLHFRECGQVVGTVFGVFVVTWTVTNDVRNIVVSIVIVDTGIGIFVVTGTIVVVSPSGCGVVVVPSVRIPPTSEVNFDQISPKWIERG